MQASPGLATQRAIKVKVVYGEIFFLLYIFCSNTNKVVPLKNKKKICLVRLEFCARREFFRATFHKSTLMAFAVVSQCKRSASAFLAYANVSADLNPSG